MLFSFAHHQAAQQKANGTLKGILLQGLGTMEPICNIATECVRDFPERDSHRPTICAHVCDLTGRTSSCIQASRAVPTSRFRLTRSQSVKALSHRISNDDDAHAMSFCRIDTKPKESGRE